MKINSNISILKDPSILSYEFDMLYNELTLIEGTISTSFEKDEKAKVNKQKGVVISKINEIIQYVLNNKIVDNYLIRKCQNYLQYRIDLFSCNCKLNKTKIDNLKEQFDAMENLLNFKPMKLTRMEVDTTITDDLKQASKIMIPAIDDSELKLFKRFKHENSSLLNVEGGEENMSLCNSLLYRDNVDDIEMNIQNNTIHPQIIYDNKKTMPYNLMVGTSVLNEGHGLFLNYLTGGNVWIESNNLKENSQLIDNFIVSYIFKILEMFPLGKVQFYILDKEDRWIFKKFALNMNSENANYLCKNTITIYKDEYEFFNDIKIKKCNEISKKMTSGLNNIYDLCAADSDETIRFAIVRNPLNQFTNEELETIIPLIRVNDTAHRCGFRFLSILDRKDQSNLSFDILNQILENSEIQFKVEDQSFMINDSLIQQLNIDDEVIKFIEEASNVLFTKLKELGSTVLSYNDIFSKNEKNVPFDSSVIKIPVGKHGSKIFELPFSAANEDQTPEGSVVSYMVIGSTGKGKSSLMHSVIINGARKYSPNDLRFWILDFKEGQESEKYKEANIPHIELLSSKNTQDDAIYVFQMILNEVKKREKLFSGYKDIHQYNKHMDKLGRPHIPHVIVIVDEAQELAANKDLDGYSDNVSILNGLIRETSSKIRAFGFHLVLIAQNLSSGNSSFISSYLPSARGRIAFSLDENALAEASFGTAFYNVKDEISRLSAGTAYIGIEDNLYKTRFAYASSFDSYFEEIREKYSAFSNLKTRIVGETSKLYSFTNIPYFGKNYHQIISELTNCDNYNQTAIIGENSYSLEPMKIDFNPDKKSSILIVGDSNKISTSIMKSIVKSLYCADNDIYVINGDKTNYIDELNGMRLGNPLTKFCQSNEKLSSKLLPVKNMNLFFEKIYKEYLRRREESASSIDEIIFKPIYILLNDIAKFDSFSNDITLFEDSFMQENNEELHFNSDYTGNQENAGDYFISKANEKLINESNEKNNPISILSAFDELIQSGYKLSIYFVVSMIGSVGNRVEFIRDSFSKLIVYNDINKDFIPNLNGNQRKIFDMLCTLKNELTEETRALLIDNNSIIKIRPVLYEMQEVERRLEERK